MSRQINSAISSAALKLLEISSNQYFYLLLSNLEATHLKIKGQTSRQACLQNKNLKYYTLIAQTCKKIPMDYILQMMPHLLIFKHSFPLVLLLHTKQIKVHLVKLLILIFGIPLLLYFLRKARFWSLNLKVIQTSKNNFKILFLELLTQILLIKLLKFFILRTLPRSIKKKESCQTKRKFYIFSLLYFYSRNF